MRILINESQYRRIVESTEPSKTAVKNICTAEKFCSTQGKITFGQLRALVDAGKRERLAKHIGEGGFKAMIRIIPWFLPQVAIAGFIGSTARALHKLLNPLLTETESYKTWWGKVVLKSFKMSEGELSLEDPFSRIFFISDGLMTMLDDKYKVKFASYISDIANSMDDNTEVPELFVENELRKWVNDKFFLDPPLQPKEIQ